MKPRKSKELASMLAQKGFRQRESHHHLFVLHVDGKATGIRTFVSHGVKEYGDMLLAKMKQQMHFQSTKQMDDFFDCSMQEADYIRLLSDTGKITITSSD